MAHNYNHLSYEDRIVIRVMRQAEEGMQKKNWCLIGGGVGINWASIDEDILVESLLRG